MSMIITISAGSILDISKYRDTCRSSIPILGGIAILASIEYRSSTGRYSILDTRYSILDTRYSILDTRYSILDTR